MNSQDMPEHEAENKELVLVGGPRSMAEKRLPMTTIVVGEIALGAGGVVNSLYGIRAGMHGDWARMSLGLFAGVLLVSLATMGCCMILLKRRIERLEAHFHTHPPLPSRRTRRIQAFVGTVMVLSLAVNISFSCWAGFRGEWLRMHLHMSASAITVIVCMGVLAVLGTGSRLSHLEQRIADALAKSPQS